MGKAINWVEVTPSQYADLLTMYRNMYIKGESGYGKTSIAVDYCKKHGLIPLIFSLATELPENIGGIPYKANDKSDYFKKLMDERLQPVLETEGEGYVLIFDELNQADSSVMNALYSICYQDPAQRHWNGHPIGKCQVIATGNLDDGSDGTVYLTEPPTPLLRRFDCYILKPNKRDTMKVLKEKYKNIPQVSKYITAMQESDIAPRDIEEVLRLLSFEHKMQATVIEQKVGAALCAKIYDIQKNIRSVDPAEQLKAAKDIYRIFKEDGSVRFGVDMVYTEEELREKLATILNDEEIEAVMKGDE